MGKNIDKKKPDGIEEAKDCLTCRWEPDWSKPFAECAFMKVKGSLRLQVENGEKVVTFIPSSPSKMKCFPCHGRESKKTQAA